MSMTINTGDDADELDDDLDERENDERDDDDGDEDSSTSTRKPKRKVEPSDDESEEVDDEDRSPEDLRAEAKKLRASLAKSNSGSQRVRNRNKELRARIAELEGRADDSDDDDDDEGDEEKAATKTTRGLDARQVRRTVDRAVKKREREIEAERTHDLIDMRLDAKLAAAGVSEKTARLLKREVDPRDLDVDLKSRRVDGIDDVIDQLRSDFPDMFRGSKAARRRINGGDDRTASRAKGKPMSASERQAASIRGH